MSALGGDDGAGGTARTLSGRVSSPERRKQYLDVAAQLVLEQGVGAVTMDAVAAGTGVNKALVYRQFPNRNELLLALYDAETNDLDEAVAEAVAGAGTFEEKVTAFVHVWFRHMGRRGTLYYRLLEARTVASDTVGVRHRQRQRDIEASFGDWYASQFGLPADCGRDVAAVLLVGLSGAMERWVASPTATTRRRLEHHYVEVLLGGLERLARSYGGDGRGDGNGKADGRAKGNGRARGGARR